MSVNPGFGGQLFIENTYEKVKKLKSLVEKKKGTCLIQIDGGVTDKKYAKEISKRIGFPVLIKASAGGGGKGMRAVFKRNDFKKNWASAKQEAKAAFGNDDMYIEKLIQEPRHIEIQIIADQYGNVCHLSERDCSIQRRHQKLTEETPSPFMT